jgi:CRP/FNR family cyclic AMP-dependent transcriptional regulator
VNRRAEAEIQNLSRKLNLVTDKLCDLDDLLRERLPSSAAARPNSQA